MPDLLETVVDKILGEAVVAGKTEDHRWLTEKFGASSAKTGLELNKIIEAYFDALNRHLGIPNC